MAHRLLYGLSVAGSGAAAGLVLFAALAYGWLCFAPDRDSIL